MMRVSLAAACMLATADAQGHNHPGGRPPKEVDLGICTIMSVFQDLQQITTSPECMAGCNSGSGDCPPEWYPSAQDSCNAECGRIFEPFWDQCGVMLTGAQMGGMDEMGLFYDDCLEELYPPGACGTFCNEHTYDCFMDEIRQACCDENGANCGANGAVPNACPVGCAIVFPEFMETCREHMDAHAEISLPEWEAFEESCLDVDGLALVDFAMELIAKGCLLDLSGGGGGGGGHRRFLQALGSWFSNRLSDNPAEPTCSYDDLDDYAGDVDYSCCGADGSMCPAEGGPPNVCTAGCAVALHQFTTTCGATLASVLGPGDELATQMTAFEGVCMETVESSHLFLDAIMNAVCPESGFVPLLAEAGAVADGWTNSEITDVGSAGTVHGPWGNDVTDVSIDIEIPAGIDSCEVSWRSWALDSRDGEVDSVQIDGVEVWSLASRCYQNVNAPGTDGWELGPTDFPNADSWGDAICFTEVTVEVSCSGTMHLNFLSGIDQAEADEAWAFSDVTVIGGYGEVTLLAEDEQGGAAADGWSNSEVTDVGSAGLVHGPWGNDATDVSIDVLIPDGFSECEVSWRSWQIDSRDGEVDSVQIDGEEVWAMPCQCHVDVTSGANGWEAGPVDFPNPWGGDGQVCFQEVTISVACHDTLHINFLSGIDQAEADESWAFSSVRVVARPSSSVDAAAQEEDTVRQESSVCMHDGNRCVQDAATCGCGAEPSGWSNEEVTFVGSAGNVHGPWGNDVTDVSIDLPIPAGITQCEVSWRSWALDSRDGEVDSVTIDGVEVWSLASRCYQNVNAPGTDGWELGPADFPNADSWGDAICFTEVTVEVPCSGTMSVHFLSGIDQAEADEAWAFSNFNVIAGYGEVTLLAEDEQGGAAADGWTNSEVTDVGSAGLVHGPWGNDATDVSIDVLIPDGYHECEVSWRSWAADSRDGEVDRVLIDDVEVWAIASSCYSGGDGWEVGPPDFPNPWGGENGQVCFLEVTVQVACRTMLRVNFLSAIDQEEADESWAFSNVRVVARP